MKETKQELKIGILGGGQLGAMLIRSAIDFGLDVSVLDKDPEANCARYTSSFVRGDLMDHDTVVNFGKGLDLITIEIEAVNVDALFRLREMGVQVYPAPETISTIQDKYLQKQFLKENNLPIVPGTLYNNKEELRNAGVKFPALLKLCRMGYDGRGVMLLHNEGDIAQAFDAPFVHEEFVNIAHELSVIVARNSAGMVKCYEPVEMVFDKARHILDYQLCPADVSSEMARHAEELAIKIAGDINLVGILAVEMFVTKEGQLLVNELAPRPHNSGHHSIEACVTSQFEQHLRAILNLPLGDTAIISPSVMVNLLGNKNISEGLHGMTELLRMSGVHIHWYGKQYREGRKLGHVTVKGSTLESAISKANVIRNFLNKE